MTRRRVVIARATAAVVGAVATVLTTVAPASAGQSDLTALRAATAPFHSVTYATHHGFGLLTDAAGIACIDQPGVGAMGIHYVNGDRVGDPSENATAPELVIYEPQKNGQLKLVAVEYVVLKSAWEGAGNTGVPRLFGEDFTLVPAGNRYGLPDFYELHVWAWKDNPDGMFEDFNPNATCQFA